MDILVKILVFIPLMAAAVIGIVIVWLFLTALFPLAIIAVPYFVWEIIIKEYDEEKEAEQ